MINIIKQWNDLEWNNRSYDEVKEGTLFERKKPLTMKELFFRDKLAVLGNFITLTLLIFYFIYSLFK